MAVRLKGVEPKHLPALLNAMRKAGRLLHGDVSLIVGSDPLPTILLYGEDLVPDNETQEK
jgi:hypothetical protein